MKMRPAGRALTRLALALAVLLTLVAARHRAVQHPSPFDPPHDKFSAAEPSKILVTHVELDLTVDFGERRLRGGSTLHVWNFSGTRTLVLDTHGLEITRVTRDGGTPATYSYGALSLWNRPLRIDIEPTTRTVTIEYRTSNQALGLNWNTARQSFGRAKPYLYTQNEPLQARSWIPIQDTPAVRVTYEATIRVEPGLLALMSCGNNPRAPNDSGVYSFAMEQSIPAYLIALAAGRIEYHAFDDRSGVYAEPELVDDAAWELQYLPDMMKAAEKILGPHPFPRHDLLLMPPTYFLGGMEHPMLNFINPFSVVTGNHPAKPEAHALIAHELAHSWAGDATTLGSWEDVWLNEGITSYLTERILEEMLGAERVQLNFMFARANYSAYANSVEDLTTTILHRTQTTPNEFFSPTAYTKGELFLKTLEDLLGRDTLDRFLRDYFRSFSFRWVDDLNFLSRLSATLGGTPDASLMLDEWLYGIGVPSNITAPASSAIYDRVAARANAFSGGASIESLGPQSWTDIEIDLFLQISNATAIRARMAEIDTALGLSFRVTPPQSWMLHAIAAKYSPANRAIDHVLLRGGTNNALISLYAALIRDDRPRAEQMFAAARDRYHPNVVANVERMLNPSSGLLYFPDAR